MKLFASVQIPNLAIAIARRDQPALVEQPLILYTHQRQRAVVAAASDDTGLAAGTPLRQAVVRCPQAVYRPIDAGREQHTRATLTNVLERYSPRVASHTQAPDAVVDLDLASSIPQAIALMQRLAQHIRGALGLLPALGVGATRLVAQRAAVSAGVGAAAVVAPGCEPAFLAPQPINVLPIDAEIIERLRLLGLATIGELARLPLDALQAQFGASGRALYQLARGGETTPIQSTLSPPTLARTARFAGPLSNRAVLETAIGQLVERLAVQLDTGGWAARAIMLTLHLEDGVPWCAQRTLGAPTADRSKLKEGYLALSRTAVFDTGIEAITLQISELVPIVAAQLELFAPASGQARQLHATLERLGTRYAGSFVRAKLADASAQLPERRVRFDSLDLP